MCFSSFDGMECCVVKYAEMSGMCVCVCVCVYMGIVIGNDYCQMSDGSNTPAKWKTY